MRLTKIKLAGFKSFVDPTTIPLIGNLAAVVGPNGCGKSNVIDAVRWVMGESSAKKLRGGELADVIFNGSSARKPLGQASVELHFDNTEGALGGEYASYTEISIRRLVTRDGQSNYFLNGTKCRRRDIKDIFLGTGMGPRSYAIIEQGMISRFIEAKPEDLRNFVEEAAGISKYKERRRETETRIKHTRENLERLTDLREELDKQLKHLQRQSEAAEKFKKLKAEERLLDAQLAALSWSRLDEEIQSSEHWIREAEVNIERDQAQRQSIDTQLENIRQEKIEASEQLNEVQERYYNIGNEIARIEQSLKHHDERKQLLADDYHQAQNELNDARNHLQTDKDQIEHVTAELENIKPEHEQAKAEFEQAQSILHEKEHALESWQEDWNQSQQALDVATRQADVEKTKIAQLEKQIQQARTRDEKLTEELDRLKQTDQSFDVDQYQQDILAGEERVQTIDDALSRCQADKRNTADSISEFKKQLNDAEKELAKNEARLTSLQTLQKALQGDDNETINAWLENQGLSDNKRLYQTLEVEPQWRHALETVLGDALESILIDANQRGDVAHALTQLETGSINITLSAQGLNPSNAHLPRLIDKITSANLEPLQGLLGGIYIANDVDDALNLLPSLQSHESVITSSGLWLSSTWMRVKHKSEESDQSILHREQEIKNLVEVIERQSTEIDANKETLKQKELDLSELDNQREDYQFERNQAFKQLTELKYTFQTQKDKLDHLNSRLTQIEQEQNDLRSQRQGWQGEIDTARALVSQSIEQMSEFSERKESLQELRANLKDILMEAKNQASEYKNKEHELALVVNRLETELNSTQGNISRFENQIQHLEDRLHQIQSQQTQNEEPIEGLKTELDTYVEQRLTIEESLALARDKVSGLEEQSRTLESDRHRFEEQVNANKERLEKKRMHWQAISVRRETALEKLKETDFDLKTLLEEMPQEAVEEAWAARLERIGNQIQRLGAINLAAIDEYAQQNERKVYLDSQDKDLNEALATLEAAISKIDKETKHRFKETFDRINANFQELFPKLFGGGHAQLSLTSDDLLETGMTVMARPPGKKNTTIHLLSGGEKALTAVSLVFSIFQLNPAPFCMLDEVDAPLDDYNVGRFCNLVKEMSKTVQFIYISHNKLALEMADQLQGVTMKEPGVSRIVTVDIEKAQSLAEA